jgi:hypothetical protein
LFQCSALHDAFGVGQVVTVTLRIINIFNLSFEAFVISQDLRVLLIADVLLLSSSRSAKTVAEVTSGVHTALKSPLLTSKMVADISWHVELAR